MRTRVEVTDSCQDFVGRAESLSLESLDMSRAVGSESLDISKTGLFFLFPPPHTSFNILVLRVVLRG